MIGRAIEPNGEYVDPPRAPGHDVGRRMPHAVHRTRGAPNGIGVRDVVHGGLGADAEYVDISRLVRDCLWLAGPLSAQTLEGVPAIPRRPMGVMEGTVDADGE